MAADGQGRGGVSRLAGMSVAVPSTVPLSWKVTVPVGTVVLGEAAVTVAVNVTAWPATAGLAVAAREVVVAVTTTGVIVSLKLPLLAAMLVVPA